VPSQVLCQSRFHLRDLVMEVDHLQPMQCRAATEDNASRAGTR
jgi:hypothetical protein